MHSVNPRTTTEDKKIKQVRIASKPTVEIKCNVQNKKKKKTTTLKPKGKRKKQEQNRWDK